MSILVSRREAPIIDIEMKPYSKYFEKIRVRPDPEAELRSRSPRCQWDGCSEAGTHRAPVGRMREGEYFRFCFNHVREYNKGFNYFSGLADTEIARFQKEAMTGHRPTWTMGAPGGMRSAPDFAQQRSGRAGYYNRMRDPFDLFKGPKDPREARERKAKPLEAKALETLGLDTKATGKDIKARYKELVKRHHPDANGGDRGSEDRFRDVLQAYRVLKQAGLC
jgi:curved DNA-binding protein CbpA